MCNCIKIEDLTIKQLTDELRKRNGVVTTVISNKEEVMGQDLFGSRVFDGPMLILEVNINE